MPCLTDFLIQIHGRKTLYNVFLVDKDLDDSTNGREDNLVKIRKNKIEKKNLLKFRRESPLKTGREVDSTSPGIPGLEKLECLPAMIQAVWSINANIQLEATTQFRKLLSNERFPPPIKEVINAGVIPRFVDFLSRSDLPQLQCIIDKGALPFLFQLLTQNHSKSIKMEALWTISNITNRTSSHIQLFGKPGVHKAIV